MYICQSLEHFQREQVFIKLYQWVLIQDLKEQRANKMAEIIPNDNTKVQNKPNYLNFGGVIIFLSDASVVPML